MSAASTPRAIVVVPARDEAQRIDACLAALAAQTVGTGRFAVVLVLDGCRDRTAEIATASAAGRGIALTTLKSPGAGVGAARRAGMELACAQLLEAGQGDGLIATTDADSRVAPDWLARQLAHRDAGATVIAGRIELDATEARGLSASVRERRRRGAAQRLRQVQVRDPDAGHHHFAGASLALTADAYRAVGGIEPFPALEDERFAERLHRHGIPVLRAADVLVTTSARVDGRASRGLSADLELESWRATRRYRASDFPLRRLTKMRPRPRVSVIIPVRECAATITGVIATTVGPARTAGLVDELVVVDAASRDGSAQRAAAAGARVLQQDALVPELGPALGKGDAMWRALQATDGEIVCFLDGDTADPDPGHLLGLLGPLLADPELVLVKGAFARPFDTGAERIPDEGGRVTELMARPLINLHAPRLAGFAQPLAGEFSARRELLEAIPFPAGYGVEIATLLDALHRHGLHRLAESDLGTRQNRHQPLQALGEMSYAVLVALERRLAGGSRSPVATSYRTPWGEPTRAVTTLERPPIDEWRTPTTTDAALTASA